MASSYPSTARSHKVLSQPDDSRCYLGNVANDGGILQIHTSRQAAIGPGAAAAPRNGEGLYSENSLSIDCSSFLIYYYWFSKYIFLDSIDMMGLLGTLRQLGAAVTIITAFSTAQASREVTLPGYGSFIGTSVNQSLTRKALPVPVDAWLGIDYASQPVGEGRFAPVGAPAAFSGTKNATQYGYSCYQDPSELRYDEACLSMNVFRPLNASSSQSLPVLIWVHGVSESEISKSSKSDTCLGWLCGRKRKKLRWSVLRGQFKRAVDRRNFQLSREQDYASDLEQQTLMCPRSIRWDFYLTQYLSAMAF